MNIPFYEERRAALIQEVTAAFDGVSREDGVSLHETTVIDDYGSLEERATARLRDTETRWQDVPEKDIRFTGAVLSFLDPKGFHYYTPAYIVWELKNMDNDDPDYWSNTFGSLIFHLTPASTGSVRDHTLSQFEFFTLEQRKSIAHYLKFEEDREDTCNQEDEQLREQSMIEEGLSQEEMDGERKRVQQIYGESGLPENNARLALERYWEQFL